MHMKCGKWRVDLVAVKHEAELLQEHLIVSEHVAFSLYVRHTGWGAAPRESEAELISLELIKLKLHVPL